MKVLVISSFPWRDDSSIGNTFSNFLSGWDNNNISNIYCRASKPQNYVCKNYYHIYEKQLIKNIFKTNAFDGKFVIEPMGKTTDEGKDDISERKILGFFRNYRYGFFLLLRELIWKCGRWKCVNLDEFLKENSPDIIFSFGLDSVYVNNILFYCKEKTNAKVVLFFSDDIYNYKSMSPFMRIYEYIVRKQIKESVVFADKLYGASQKLCNEFSGIFGKEWIPLYKGCEIEDVKIKENVGKPIKIVYTGNLLFGRWKTLSLIVDALKYINKNEVKATMQIYTQFKVSKKINKALNTEGTSKIMGRIPYEDVKMVLSDADIVLHAESFDKKQRKGTRLSFSTKIIDCMQSGSCLMAIGPSDIASMEYLINSNVALTATSEKEIYNLMENVIKDPQTILEYAEKMNSFAIGNHNIKIVREKIIRDFQNILG